MLKKLYRKLAGKRSAIDVFLDRPWAIQVAPLAGGTMADFDGDTNTITVNANLPDAMRDDVLAVLTAKPYKRDAA